MKRLLFICWFLLYFLGLQAQGNCSALLPMPNHVVLRKGKAFQVIPDKSRIYFNDVQLQFVAQQVQKDLSKEMNLQIPTSNNPQSCIKLLIDHQIKGEQEYILTVSSKQLVIRGSTPQAIFYGAMTLHQILIGDICATTHHRINPIQIEDTPRFSYRALMLDPARHFLPVEDVKLYIDKMARYKYNVLQLHLTDDQGWRIEIKKHPKLASKQHYSQKMMKELIKYAAERHIEIVPEIDIPGHTVALLATYPELGCTTSDTIQKVIGKTVNLMVCANNQKVYDIFEDIFEEIATIFPSNYIHLGGDESVIDKNWALCRRCQQLLREKHYSKAGQLMIPFFNTMLSQIKKLGKNPILWCELDNIYPPATDYLFPYPKEVTLVTWRNGLTPKCIELTRKNGHELIMAPGEYTYFDYPQLKGDLPEFNNWGMPITTLRKVYEFDPGYGLPEKQQAHIKGVMGTLWGEAMPDIHRVTYMTYPRALALAEAGWTHLQFRNWNSFKRRLYPNLYNLMKEGVSVRVPFEIKNINE